MHGAHLVPASQRARGYDRQFSPVFCAKQIRKDVRYANKKGTEAQASHLADQRRANQLEHCAVILHAAQLLQTKRLTATAGCHSTVQQSKRTVKRPKLQHDFLWAGDQLAHHSNNI